MILKQYHLGCLAHASCLIADEDAGSAAAVDPQRDIEQYPSDSRRLGCRIQHVLLTHFHADFVAGHLATARARHDSVESDSTPSPATWPAAWNGSHALPI